MTSQRCGPFRLGNIGAGGRQRGAGSARALLSAAIVAVVTACSTPNGEPRESTAKPEGVSLDASPTLAIADTSTVTVYKSPTCGCCQNWVDTLRARGFRVITVDTSDVASVKTAFGVSDMLGSCHTARVAGYVIEGHVPPGDISRLLRERPGIVGLAVPGMPRGSPGMEGPHRDPYHVLSFDRSGATRGYSSY